MNIDKRLISPDEENAVIACADLVGRSGARQFQIGYLHDDVPAEQAGWYAYGQYRGTRIAVQDQPSPAAAALALAHRILTGAKCKCGKLVALSSGGARAFENTTLADGTTWTLEQAAAAGQCLWTLIGRTWTPSCTAPSITLEGGR